MKQGKIQILGLLYIVHCCKTTGVVCIRGLDSLSGVGPIYTGVVCIRGLDSLSGVGPIYTEVVCIRGLDSLSGVGPIYILRSCVYETSI